MIPIRDDTPRFHPPYVTYFLIAFNLIIYGFESTLDRNSLRLLLEQLGVVPLHVVRLFEGTGKLDAISALTPILTSMFLHGSWPHVIGNMWFLWIFGDNIEDYLGHFQYLVFYLVSGITAAAAQILLTPTSRIPTVGASGAIAGVLGAYFLLYPRARVLTWFPILFVFYLPAWVMLGYWFALQFLSGAASAMASSRPDAGGIAFWAHVGGFVAGAALVKLFPRRKEESRYGAW
jgi:membrane associated rhomboid family serine protease